MPTSLLSLDASNNARRCNIPPRYGPVNPTGPYNARNAVWPTAMLCGNGIFTSISCEIGNGSKTLHPTFG